MAAELWTADLIVSETDSLEDARDGGSVGYDDTETKLRENFNTLYEEATTSNNTDHQWLLDFVDDHCDIDDDIVSSSHSSESDSPYDQCRYAVLDLLLDYLEPAGYILAGVAGLELL
eukprot:CAMPEP_0182473246 /NCGR_PEP_ID=MMETSP1319-20130603/23562_1 /TAXON_ID=172717 /ORGANISM="Bolidomonas pacifica, Strain RCC208" /LENGTH=116 /DNA_ID=CAMNT_0024674011 /DNA_START=6 /DNA_END=352 /DNA_ORIENTATION=+